MSFIFGINLSDRIYLSADTRLTYKQKGQIKSYKDRLLKVQAISPYISVAMAGSAAMASFIIKKLLKSEISRLDIRTFRQNVESILGPIVDEYWRKVNKHDRVCIIFGGINKNARKALDFQSINSKVLEFSRLDKDNVQMNLKPELFNTFLIAKGETPLTPEPCDSTIFGVNIVPPMGFKVDDTKWGDYLGYGANGLNKSSLPDITLGRLEFEARSPQANYGHDHTVITAFINRIAVDYQEKTIGGPVYTMMMSETLSGPVVGRIQSHNLLTGKKELLSDLFQDLSNNIYYRDKNGTHYKLKKLSEYKDFGSLYL